MIIAVISLCFLLVVVVGAVYLYLLAAASLMRRRIALRIHPSRRFAIAIPAHDEEVVIGQTVARLKQLDYPANLCDVYVVADFCVDRTAEVARGAGAICLERNDGARGSKGAALAWLFEHIFAAPQGYDALVIFDADTLVAPDFLRVMNARLQAGALVVQGRHCIINADDSLFAALTSAMFIVDNRFQNLGRSNLGWSAKHMGDSICFRADILQRLGWGEGLTEDYQFRQRLLLDGIAISYEPDAVGYGEAPTTWAQARSQRARWLRGTYLASRRLAWTMLTEGLRRRNLALLDGWAQAALPSYSTLALISFVMLMVNLLVRDLVASWLSVAWGMLVGALAVYPLLGLLLERAPWRTYVAMLLGPIFIVWRTGLSLVARFGKPVTWVRTARRGMVGMQKPSNAGAALEPHD